MSAMELITSAAYCHWSMSPLQLTPVRPKILSWSPKAILLTAFAMSVNSFLLAATARAHCWIFCGSVFQ